jgi:ubiquinone/menaquinone biosynthesis C-methylase UbiE
MPDEIFWEIHSDLPREGPGDNESTRRSFLMMSELPENARILDVACGPGMQTLELARISLATITAVDTHQPFLDELARRAHKHGFTDRIEIINASMFSMPFAENSFDAIWCEGAMYIMGVNKALSDWKRFLKTHSYIAFTEPCFLKDKVPEPARQLWMNDYPAMTDVDGTLSVIKQAGYKLVDFYTIPQSAWWDDYYMPMESRLKVLREKYRDQPTALESIEYNQREIDFQRKYFEYYGYVFFVIQCNKS